MTFDTRPFGDRRNLGIQWMRALAALLVVVDHSLYTLAEKAHGDPAVTALAAALGGTGVAAFFVISGYVMIVSSTNAFGTGAALRFVRRRLTRIVPLYWLATLVYGIKLLLTGEQVPLIDLTRSLLFIPYLNPHGEMQPVYGLGWTLNYEVFFYGIFAIGLLWSLRATLSLTVVTLASLIWLGNGPGAPDPGSASVPFFFWSRPVMLFFVIGMGLPFLARKVGAHLRLDFRAAGVLSIGLLALAVAVPSSPELFPVSLLLIGGAVLVAASSRVDATRTGASVVSAMGDASYSIYLTHSFLLGPLGRLYGKLGWTAPMPFIVAALIGCSVLGWLCHRHVERPLLRRLAAPRRSIAPAGVAP